MISAKRKISWQSEVKASALPSATEKEKTMNQNERQSLEGTQSIQNIYTALNGEAMARLRYFYWAEHARKLGNEEISKLFQDMERNETQHGLLWFNLLNEVPDTIEAHLLAAANNENREWKQQYLVFAETARKEGFDILATMFEKIAAIENDHEQKFREAYLALLRQKEAQQQPDAASIQPEFQQSVKSSVESSAENQLCKKRFRCVFCGNFEDQALESCPICGALGAFEEICPS